MAAVPDAPDRTGIGTDDDVLPKSVEVLKSTRISVFVDEALPDILVVTYEFGVKMFKGVLLDSNKKNLPCGVQSLNPAFKATPQVKPPAKTTADDDVLFSTSQRFTYLNYNQKNQKQMPGSRYKNKMTVRLRPRQVLCSKCKGICNENSENVSRKRKHSQTFMQPLAQQPAIKRGVNAPVTRSVSSVITEINNHKLGHGSLVPRLTRLTPQEEMDAINGVPLKSPTLTSNKENDDNSDSRQLRKKRSIGSMEDLWDETVFEEKRAAPTRIKISFGPQGEGTVVKIPTTTDEKTSECEAKATRKALKKAKREARKKFLLGGRGNLSNNNNNNEVVVMVKRKKHKVKHKKRDKDRGRHRDSTNEVSSSTHRQGGGGQQDGGECQKLSINLKRLTSYPTSDGSNTSSDDDVMPDFPPPPVLRITSRTVSSVTLADGTRMLVGDVVWGKIHGFPWWPGKVLTITNPPGSTAPGGPQGPHAHVAWYGSSTSSLMQCDQLTPFLDNFKVRYNKRKRGPYKEAIKQATVEARENAEARVRQPLGTSPQSSRNIMQVVPPALASPREIDVVS